MRAVSLVVLSLVIGGCSMRTEPRGHGEDRDWLESPPPAVERSAEELALEGTTGTALPGELLVDPATPEVEPLAYGPLDVSDAWLSGDMGNVRGFAGEPYRTEGSNDGYSTNVTMYLRSEHGSVVMLGIHVMGLDSIEVGRRYVSGAYGGGEGGVFISGIACSGPGEGSWEYDSGPNQIGMTMALGPDGERIFQIDTQLVRYGAGPEEPTYDFTGGTFTVRPGASDW